MRVNYNIYSNVIDISTDIPSHQDVFFVDTNIWFWMTYTKANPLPYQLNNYPTYINKILSRNGEI